MAMNRDNRAGGAQGSAGRAGRGSGRRSARGFAAMDVEKQREIARKGGQASARSQTRDAQGQFGGRREPGMPGQGGTRGRGNAGR